MGLGKTRQDIVFVLNGRRVSVTGTTALATVSDYLRYDRQLTGTKVVCAEGDCGACTVLVASIHDLAHGKWQFRSINSCILPVLALDGANVVTVEGLKSDGKLHPVQDAMLRCFGSQCGYCTPGFVCAMTALTEDATLKKKPISEKRAKNYLTGNLCRCTGYQPILDAAMSLDPTKIETLQGRYHDKELLRELTALAKQPVAIEVDENRSVYLPATLDQALKWKKEHREGRIVAGATDLGVQINKGRAKYSHLMSLQNIARLYEIKTSKTSFEIGARVSLTKLQSHIEEHASEFDRMLNIFASPQIKNAGTLVGNIVNGSPIADTIPYLMASDATVEVRSIRGKRMIAISEFYLGYKKLDLKPDEIVVAIHLPRAEKDEVSKLYKVSLRKDLDISAVTMAMRLRMKADKISEARLVFGGVGPTVVRLSKSEKNWVGKKLERPLFDGLAKEISKLVKPISDVRGSSEFRNTLCQNLVRRAADELESEGVL